MLVYILFNLLVLYCCCLPVKSQILTGPEDVQLSQGVARGGLKYVAGRAIYYFLGIPYAQAPIGSMRFRPSSPHEGWQGSYVAQFYKPVCPQPTGSPSVKNTMSEDCLFLNVWTSNMPTSNDYDTRPRPVIVIIEGN
jgi:carboxylesterase type B